MLDLWLVRTNPFSGWHEPCAPAQGVNVRLACLDFITKPLGLREKRELTFESDDLCLPV